MITRANSYLYFSFVCDAKSRLEYCLVIELRPVSPLPWPPWAGAKVGREAVVMFQKINTTQF